MQPEFGVNCTPARATVPVEAAPWLMRSHTQKSNQKRESRQMIRALIQTWQIETSTWRCFGSPSLSLSLSLPYWQRSPFSLFSIDPTEWHHSYGRALQMKGSTVPTF